MGINLLNYVLAKNYTDSAVRTAIQSVYRYCGSVETYDDLPASGLTVGDVYDVRADGTNYAWNGESWDSLGVNQVATFTRNGLAKLATSADLPIGSNIDYSTLTPLERGYFFKPTIDADVVNIQQPGFAEKEGVYITVAAGVGRVTVNGSENEGLYAVQGAGVIVYLSSLVKEKNTVIITYAGGEVEVELYNQNGEPEGGSPQETDAKIVNPYHLINYQTAWWNKTRKNPTLLGATVTTSPLEVTSGFIIGGSSDSTIAGNDLSIVGEGQLKITKETIFGGDKDVNFNNIARFNNGVAFNDYSTFNKKAYVQDIQFIGGQRTISTDNLTGTNVVESIILGVQSQYSGKPSRTIVLGTANNLLLTQGQNTIANSLVIGNNNSTCKTNYILGDSNQIGISLSACDRNLIVGNQNQIGVGSEHNYTFGVNNVVGANNKSSKYGLIVGTNNNIANRVAIEYSSAIGQNLTTDTSNQFIIGKYNNNKEDTLFEIGNGVEGTPSNAFEVTTNGNIRAEALEYNEVVKTNQAVQIPVETDYSPTKYKITEDERQVVVLYDSSLIPSDAYVPLYFTWYKEDGSYYFGYYYNLTSGTGIKELPISRTSELCTQVSFRMRNTDIFNYLTVKNLQIGDVISSNHYERPIKDIINYEYDVSTKPVKIITGANMAYGQPKTYNLYNLTNNLDSFDLTFTCTQGNSNPSRVYIIQSETSYLEGKIVYDETKMYNIGDSFTIHLTNVKNKPWIGFYVNTGETPKFDGYYTAIHKKSLINSQRIIPEANFNSTVKENGAYYLIKNQTTNYFGQFDNMKDYKAGDIVYTVDEMPNIIDFTKLVSSDNLINKYSIPSTNAFSSSTAIPGGYLPQEAFDLNTGSQWRTQMPCADEEYLGIHLGQERTFSYFAVAWDYYFYPPTFYAQTSEDGTNWTTVQEFHQNEMVTNNAAVYKFDSPLTTKHFRLLMPNTDQRDSGYATFEVGLFEGNLQYWQFTEDYYGEGKDETPADYAVQYTPSSSFDFTIADVSYQVVDRHKNVILDSGLQIPAPTAADEGKILQIVNGKLTYVDKATITGETIEL